MWTHHTRAITNTCRRVSDEVWRTRNSNENYYRLELVYTPTRAVTYYFVGILHDTMWSRRCTRSTLYKRVSREKMDSKSVRKIFFRDRVLMSCRYDDTKYKRAKRFERCIRADCITLFALKDIIMYTEIRIHYSEVIHILQLILILYLCGRVPKCITYF